MSMTQEKARSVPLSAFLPRVYGGGAAALSGVALAEQEGGGGGEGAPRVCADNNLNILGNSTPAPAHLPLGLPDAVLKGGLSLGELHELSPVSFLHSGAALGFALALATLNRGQNRSVVLVQQDFAALETGLLYAPGCTLFGLDPAHLLVVRASSPRDVLWAMEEALKTRGLAAAIGELAEDGKAADLTATRRLSLAVQKGGGLALLLRHRPAQQPSAAATRWQVAATPGGADGFGGLERPAFHLSLTKNRRGSCGSWVLHWDHYAERFLPAVSFAVAAPSRDRQAHAAFAVAG